MNKKFVALLLLLAMLPTAPICLAQEDHTQNQWRPPSWVFGSGYTPYDYPTWGYWYDPFSYYSYQGKTYHPNYYSYYYNYPYNYRWYPYNYWWYW